MKTAFPLFKTPVDITLYSNIPFDNTYQHHSMISELFEDDDDDIYTAGSSLGLAKERFINRRNTNGVYVYPRYELTGEFNFDFSNGLLCSVVLELTPAQTNANYMKVVNHAQDLTGGIYYYFITGIQQINYDTYKLSLELDVLMTYQDEFLEGIRGIPVSTKRKHCHRFNYNGYPHCADFKTGEDAFAGVKPSQVMHNADLGFEFKGNMKALKGIDWLYVCIETDTPHDISFTNLFGTVLPFCMLVIPMKSLRFVPASGGAGNFEIGPSRISQLIGDGKIHGCKISPYPPFNDPDIQVSQNGAWLEIRSPHLISSHTGTSLYSWSYSTDFSLLTITQRPEESDSNAFYRHAWHINSQKDSKYEFEPIHIINDYKYPNLTINDAKILDPKLLFNPFRKYMLCSQYSEGAEIYPELYFSDFAVANDYLTFETSATAYIGDNNLTTYIKPIYDSDNNKYAFDHYKELNIGLSSSLNYSIPAGTNALDVFNSTQAQSYYQSKIATGITSGLAIAGGVGSTIAGIALTASAYGAPMGVGLIGGGVSAIAGGIAGEVNNAKSVNAKIEDLRNTPDSVNVVGSNYVSDLARVGVNMPYLIVYNCSNAIIESANDMFYHYGYAVARNCSFNLDLDYDGETKIDNRLFGRTIFNYIQLNEDITNKINYDMPLIVKQKLSKIFSQGITLWSFFGNASLWGATDTPTYLNDPNKWFMRENYENAEFNY